MPRISPSLIRQAQSIDKLLPALLLICRDLHAAKNELRWLRQHALKTQHLYRASHYDSLLRQYVLRRAKGEPLQYILGSEFFGDLEIKCAPGVLIPRQDTAASVTHLTRLISRNKNQLNYSEKLAVLDICTGSGCIPLLFHSEFYSQARNKDTILDLCAVDISPFALRLATENVENQLKEQKTTYDDSPPRMQSLASIKILQANVLQRNLNDSGKKSHSVVHTLATVTNGPSTPKYDVVISNPPYISTRSFRTTTARSVRFFEPKLALVPEAGHGEDGDAFYPPLLKITEQVDSKIALFEVADLDQAKRVAAMAISSPRWKVVEIWKDEPGDTDTFKSREETVVGDRVITIRGTGNGRSVFLSTIANLNT